MKYFNTIFSVRCANCLRQADIHTWEDLLTKIEVESDLLKIPNFGLHSLKEITDFLARYNMKLGNRYVNPDIFMRVPPLNTSILFTKREKKLMELINKHENHLDDKTYDFYAHELGISTTRVRQLLQQCCLKIRAYYYRKDGDRSRFIEANEKKSMIIFVQQYLKDA